MYSSIHDNPIHPKDLLFISDLI